jgi:ubiquinone/menaquinone biosynthesis C-methylase UbiE
MNNGVSHAYSSPFDPLAKEYDELYEQFIVTKEIRPIIRRSLLEHLKPNDHVLELNCGTGTDAIALAYEGMRVVATDASEKMLEAASAKIDLAGLQEKIALRKVDFNKFSQATFNNARFDGVFSNFDGLNCAPNISIVFDNIAGSLKPGGTLVICILNKFCLWETGSFLLRGRINDAIRRFRNGSLDASLGETRIPVWYYTPSQIISLLQPKYKIVDLYGVNIFSPTLNSMKFAAHWPVLTKKLLSLDSYICRFRPFSGMGDHIVVTAERR